MERYSVDISRQARADMRGILHYIAMRLREPSTAEHTLDRLEETVSSLAVMPKRFALVPDSCLAAAGFRMTSVGNYLVFYTLDEDKKVVNISRVLSGRQNWMELLTRDLS
ncbi:MAG: type II toxin-antitoxin system RelE/ParE family toxin [Lawsonibacter sp.]|nr:type II toxin-antitoxin system RelE/ParE family toxin [Lawsonibacter sp.]